MAIRDTADTAALAPYRFFFNGLAEVWSMRAVGLWVARFAPEWAEEAKDSKGSLS